MKVFFYRVMILIGVSLFLPGCPQDESGKDSGGGGGTMSGILTVPSGTTFTVKSGQTYTVGNGGEIRVAKGGDIVIQTKAMLIVKAGGKILAEAEEGTACINIEPETQAENDNGALIVYEGATVALGKQLLRRAPTRAVEA
jgi:hypothetical protein